MTHLLHRAGATLWLAALLTTPALAQDPSDPYDPDGWHDAPRLTLIHSDWTYEASLVAGLATYTSHDLSVRVHADLSADQLEDLRLAYAVAAKGEQAQPSPLIVWHPTAMSPRYLDLTRYRSRRLERLMHDQAAALTDPPRRATEVALSVDDVTPGGTRTLAFDGRRASLSYQLGLQTYALPAPKLTFAERLTLRILMRRLRLEAPAPTFLAFLPHGLSRGDILRVRHRDRELRYRSLPYGLPVGSERLVDALREILGRAYYPDERTLRGRVFQGRLMIDGLPAITAEPLTSLVPTLEGHTVEVHGLIQTGEWVIALHVQGVVTATQAAAAGIAEAHAHGLSDALEPLSPDGD